MKNKIEEQRRDQSARDLDRTAARKGLSVRRSRTAALPRARKELMVYKRLRITVNGLIRSQGFEDGVGRLYALCNEGVFTLWKRER